MSGSAAKCSNCSELLQSVATGVSAWSGMADFRRFLTDRPDRVAKVLLRFVRHFAGLPVKGAIGGDSGIFEAIRRLMCGAVLTGGHGVAPTARTPCRRPASSCRGKGIE